MKKYIKSSTLWMGKYIDPKGNKHKVYFSMDSKDFDEAEDYFNDIIPEPYTKAILLGTGPSESLLKKDGFTKIESNVQIKSSIYRQYENPYDLESQLEVEERELADLDSKGLLSEDDIIERQLYIDELRDRINYAYQDEEYDENYVDDYYL